VEALRVKDMTYQLVNTVDSSMSYGLTQEVPVSELQRISSQGFSDDTGVAELRIDLTQILQTPEAVMLNVKRLMLVLVSILWKSIKPKEIISLRPGEIRRVSDKLLVEKTSDGKIILYEVID